MTYRGSAAVCHNDKGLLKNPLRIYRNRIRELHRDLLVRILINPHKTGSRTRVESCVDRIVLTPVRARQLQRQEVTGTGERSAFRKSCALIENITGEAIALFVRIVLDIFLNCATKCFAPRYVRTARSNCGRTYRGFTGLSTKTIPFIERSLRYRSVNW